MAQAVAEKGEVVEAFQATINMIVENKDVGRKKALLSTMEPNLLGAASEPSRIKQRLDLIQEWLSEGNVDKVNENLLRLRDDLPELL